VNHTICLRSTVQGQDYHHNKGLKWASACWALCTVFSETAYNRLPVHPALLTSCYILFPTFRRLALQSLALIQDLDLKPNIALVVQRSIMRLNRDSGDWGLGGQCLLSKLLSWPFHSTYSPGLYIFLVQPNLSGRLSSSYLLVLLLWFFWPWLNAHFKPHQSKRLPWPTVCVMASLLLCCFYLSVNFSQGEALFIVHRVFLQYSVRTVAARSKA
jgi:hypothetical protein